MQFSTTFNSFRLFVLGFTIGYHVLGPSNIDYKSNNPNLMQLITSFKLQMYIWNQYKCKFCT